MEKTRLGIRRPSGKDPRAGLFLVLALAALSFAVVQAETGAEGWHRDGAGFEAVVDPAGELFTLPDPLGAFTEHARSPEDLLDAVLTLEHDVPIAEGETLRVHELLTLRSWLRRPKRAILFLTTTAITEDLWRIPVEGYNGPEMAARRGFFAFTVDYVGVGDNYRPGLDALDSTFERNLDALRHVVRYIRYFRAVSGVDLVGESWGGAHATQLAADTERIRSCVLSSMAYKVTHPMFLSPELVAMLRNLPDNYLPANPEMLVRMAAGAPEAVKSFIRKTQTGPRLTTQLWQFQKGLPHFDPGVARAPGLVISGPSEAADHRELADDYGSDGAEYFEIEGGEHASRLQSPETAARFWEKVFEHIDAPREPR